MKSTILTFLFIITFLFSACEKVDNTLLEGKWNAAMLLEKGADKKLDLNDVNFEFHTDGTYSYQSSLNYKEAGHYHTTANVLYTTDTIATGAIEKAVKIIKLTTDSLYFEMNDKGRDQELRLYRSK